MPCWGNSLDGTMHNTRLTYADWRTWKSGKCEFRNHMNMGTLQEW